MDTVKNNEWTSPRKESRQRINKEVSPEAVRKACPESKRAIPSSQRAQPSSSSLV